MIEDLVQEEKHTTNLEDAFMNQRSEKQLSDDRRPTFKWKAILSDNYSNKICFDYTVSGQSRSSWAGPESQSGPETFKKSVPSARTDSLMSPRQHRSSSDYCTAQLLLFW